MTKRMQGFTLVEIAIVLVIIGLLLGGILKGQEMITQAKIKNVIADFSGVSAAYHGYQDRYRAIPGDDPNGGDALGLDDHPGASGGRRQRHRGGHLQQWRGDVHHGGGVVQLVGSPPQGWFRLGQWRAAALQCGHRQIGVQTGDGAVAPGPTLLNVSGGNGFVGLIMCSANLPDKIAIAVDTQMDDGNSNQGTVRGLIQGAPNPNIGATLVATPSYAETGTNVYVLCRAF